MSGSGRKLELAYRRAAEVRAILTAYVASVPYFVEAVPSTGRVRHIACTVKPLPDEVPLSLARSRTPLARHSTTWSARSARVGRRRTRRSRSCWMGRDGASTRPAPSAASPAGRPETERCQGGRSHQAAQLRPVGLGSRPSSPRTGCHDRMACQDRIAFELRERGQQTPRGSGANGWIRGSANGIARATTSTEAKPMDRPNWRSLASLAAVLRIQAKCYSGGGEALDRLPPSLCRHGVLARTS